MNEWIAQAQIKQGEEKEQDMKSEESEKGNDDDHPSNHGKLIVDATCAPRDLSNGFEAVEPVAKQRKTKEKTIRTGPINSTGQGRTVNIASYAASA